MDQMQKEQVRKQIDEMTRSVTMKGHSEEEIETATHQILAEQMAREEVLEKRQNFLDGKGHTLGDQFKWHVQQAQTPSLEQQPKELIKERSKIHRKANREIRKKNEKIQAENDALKNLNSQVNEWYEDMRSTTAPEEAVARQTLETDEKYNFIHSNTFITEYQYEAFATARQWMMENPENYLENKEAVDAMYKDLFLTAEVVAAVTREARYYQFIPGTDKFQEKVENHRKNPAQDRAIGWIGRDVEHRAFLLGEKVNFLSKKYQELYGGLCAILKGKKVNESGHALVREYKDIGMSKLQGQEGAKNVEAERARRLHMIDSLRSSLTEKVGTEEAEKILQSDTARAQMFIREETSEENKSWNQDVTELVLLRNLEKEKGSSGGLSKEEDARLRGLVRNVMGDAFDELRGTMGDDPLAYVEKYQASDDVLVQDMDRLCALALKLQHTSDLSKYTTVPKGKTTIMAAYEKQHKLDDRQFRAMSLMVQQLATKARWLSYIRAYQTGNLTPEMVIPGDSNGLPQLKRDGQGEITNGEEVINALFQKAEQRLAMADRQLKTALSQYKEARA